MIDTIDHDQGCGDLYRAAIRRTDARVGRLLAAVASRPERAAENWTFILVTDHGQVLEGGADYGTLRHVDVAAHVYAALGVEPGIVLDGKAFAAVL